MSKLSVPEQADAEDLIRLRAGFFESQIAAGLLDLPEDMGEMLASSTPRLIKSSRATLRIGRIAGVAEGYVYGSRKVVPGVTKPVVCAIEEIYVSEAARGTGLASALFNAAKEAFLEQEADRIQLRVLSANVAGHGFWKSLGFSENVVTYELDF